MAESLTKINKATTGLKWRSWCSAAISSFFFASET